MNFHGEPVGMQYIAISNRPCTLVFVVLSLFTISQALSIFNNNWLVLWRRDVFNKGPLFYLGLYLALGLVTGSLVRVFVF